ncbi:hypothetical protein BKA80DRAFT_280741 [Phyllosticta citrichinensis]
MCLCSLSGHSCRMEGCSKEHRCPFPKCAGDCGLPHGQFQVKDQTCSLFLRDRARHALQFPDTTQPCPRGHDLPPAARRGKKQRNKAKQQDEAMKKAAACAGCANPGHKTEDCWVARPEKKANHCVACYQHGHVASVCWHLHADLAPAAFTADSKIVERFLKKQP